MLNLPVFPSAGGGHELKLEEGTEPGPTAILTLTSNAEVQGLIAAFDWAPESLRGSDLIPGSALAAADLVVRRVEPSYMVFGVIMDDDGIGGEILPAGTHALATAKFQCLSFQAEDVPVDLEFRDHLYGSADLGPLLYNMITVGGQTISRVEGLILTPGRVICPKAQPGKLRIRDAVADPDSRCSPADILLDSYASLQGFAIAVAHDPAALSLSGITIDGTVTRANGADFASGKIYTDGGTLEVVMDLDPPFLGNTIPPGLSQVIARYIYCCMVKPPPGEPDAVTVLRFVDGVLGEPPVDNIFLRNGERERPAEMIPGTFTCPAEKPEKPQEFHCGGPVEGEAEDLPPIIGFPGTTVKVCFYYRSLPKGTPGDTGEDQIQGLSMAICYDPRYVNCLDGTFDILGTITEAVGAEFVNHHCENSAEDGDPGELVIGILVDAVPPFDGHTLPPSEALLRIGCISFSIAPDAPCEKCNEVSFCAGADGRGDVWIRNLATINYRSVKPALFNCDICVAATPKFQRGDCNFSRGSRAVDIADPAAIISLLFGNPKYEAPCISACDANDDGRVDFADSIFILRFIFMEGREPPPPGPRIPGADPTPDRLDCKGGSICQ